MLDYVVEKRFKRKTNPGILHKHEEFTDRFRVLNVKLNAKWLYRYGLPSFIMLYVIGLLYLADSLLHYSLPVLIMLLSFVWVYRYAGNLKHESIVISPDMIIHKSYKYTCEIEKFVRFSEIVAVKIVNMRIVITMSYGKRVSIPLYMQNMSGLYVLLAKQVALNRGTDKRRRSSMNHLSFVVDRVKGSLGIYPKEGVTFETLENYLRINQTPERLIEACMYYVDELSAICKERTDISMIGPRTTWRMKHDIWITEDRLDDGLYGEYRREYEQEIKDYIVKMNEMEHVGLGRSLIHPDRGVYLSVEGIETFIVLTTLLGDAVRATVTRSNYKHILRREKTICKTCGK